MYDTLIERPLTQSQRCCMQLIFLCVAYARRCGRTQTVHVPFVWSSLPLFWLSPTQWQSSAVGIQPSNPCLHRKIGKYDVDDELTFTAVKNSFLILHVHCFRFQKSCCYCTNETNQCGTNRSVLL